MGQPLDHVEFDKSDSERFIRRQRASAISVALDTVIVSLDPEAKDSSARHPITYGFSLPLSRTPSTDTVAKVSCQVVSCMHGNQAWKEYVNESTPSNHSSQVRVRDCSQVLFLTNLGTQTSRDLERAWIGNERHNRGLFSLLGPSTCATLIKVGPRYTTYPKPTLF